MDFRDSLPVVGAFASVASLAVVASERGVNLYRESQRKKLRQRVEAFNQATQAYHDTLRQRFAVELDEEITELVVQIYDRKEVPRDSLRVEPFAKNIANNKALIAAILAYNVIEARVDETLVTFTERGKKLQMEIVNTPPPEKAYRQVFEEEHGVDFGVATSLARMIITPTLTF